MDSAWIEQLYRTHGPSVLRRARAMLGSEAEARDAMQEVFVQAIRAGSAFRGQASPMTWLYRMTTNHCLNLIRDRGNQRALLECHAAVRGETPPGPTQEDRLTLAAVLEEVPASLQEVAVYYYVDRMSQSEIAELLGMSRRTVGYRLEQFCAKARERLAKPAVA